MNKFFDTHAHVCGSFYKTSRELSLKHALLANVSRILLPGTSVEDSKANIDFAKQHSGTVYAAVGIHPSDAFNLEDVAQLATLPREHISAIGETGLDLYHVKTNPPLAKQVAVFKAHLKLARRWALPVIVHARNAEQEVYEVIKDFSDLTFIMHSYTGSLESARLFLTLPNVYFSFSGPISYKAATNLHEVAKALPLERLLVETDSPFLTPEPFRGKPNEPANVVFVAKALAALRPEKDEVVFDALFANSLRALGINEK